MAASVAKAINDHPEYASLSLGNLLWGRERDRDNDFRGCEDFFP